MANDSHATGMPCDVVPHEFANHIIGRMDNGICSPRR